MLPDPLHPAIVHYPIVLATLLPLAAIVALILIARGSNARKTWTVIVVLSALLAVASFVALRTGEAEEEAVEEVVAEDPLHEHEEAGERMLVFSGVGVLLMAIGLANGKLGRAGRWIGTAGSVVLLVAAYQAGKLGGELVYEHGAASAYTDTLPAAGQLAPRVEREED